MTELPSDAVTGAGVGFAPVDHGARWTCTGPLTFANAGRVLAATRGVALPAKGEVDLENVATIDSSAVAVLLALKRRAETEQKPLRFSRVPAALLALAEVYGIASILGG